MPLARHLTPDSNKNTQVPRTVNTHTELTGGPAYPDCRPPPGRSVTDSQPVDLMMMITVSYIRTSGKHPNTIPSSITPSTQAA